MIVRNRFDTVQPNHYRLTKGSKVNPSASDCDCGSTDECVKGCNGDTYKLQLYLSGMNGDM